MHTTSAHRSVTAGVHVMDARLKASSGERSESISQRAMIAEMNLSGQQKRTECRTRFLPPAQTIPFLVMWQWRCPR